MGNQYFLNLGIYTLSQENHRLDGEILLKGWRSAIPQGEPANREYPQGGHCECAHNCRLRYAIGASMFHLDG
jgi:hypothetical protein